MPNLRANSRPRLWPLALSTCCAGARWSKTTTTFSGSWTCRISRQTESIRLLSNRMEVSTRTVTTSPGRTSFKPPLRARIFSIAVIPMEIAPFYSAARAGCVA